MSVKNIEKRTETRYPICKKVEYTGSTGENFNGLAINISNSGLCLYIYNILNREQEITINSALPVSCQTATVCWVNQVDTDFYMAGLIRKN